MAWVTVKVDGELGDVSTRDQWYVGEIGNAGHDEDVNVSIKCNGPYRAEQIRDLLNAQENS